MTTLLKYVILIYSSARGGRRIYIFKHVYVNTTLRNMSPSASLYLCLTATMERIDCVLTEIAKCSINNLSNSLLPRNQGLNGNVEFGI